MARAKTSEQSRSRSKAATIEELTRGVGNLQEFLAQVKDLGREGFPYLDAARARTELQFRECIRRTFGEKSPEFQEHRHHKFLLDSPEETQQSITLIKTLIATLEQKKRELQGGPSPRQIQPTPAAPPAPTRPQMTLVPSPIPKVQMTMIQTPPVTPPPIIMSVAMTTNLDLSSTTAAPTAPPPPLSPSSSSGEQEPLVRPTSLPETSPISSAQTTKAMPDTPPQPAVQLAPAPLHPPPQTAQTEQAASSKAGRPPQPPRGEPEPIVPPIPSVKPEHQMQEPPPVPAQLQPAPAMQIDSSYQEPAPPPPQAGSDPIELVKTLCSRFHSVARQLRLRGEYRATLSVEDEIDAQDLLHALLRIQFDDIAMDEWTPSYSSAAPRTTFLLNDSRLAVIVKKTRPGLSAKDLTDQLRIDAERYRSHDRCATLLCFIYDPEGRIGNPRGLETNLTSVSDSFVIEVLVAPK
jgi:hypothetical protein